MILRVKKDAFLMLESLNRQLNLWDTIICQFYVAQVCLFKLLIRINFL